MIPKLFASTSIAVILWSLSVPLYAQSPGFRLREPGPIAISAAKITAYRFAQVQMSSRSRVRRQSCMAAMLRGAGLGAGIGLGFGAVFSPILEDGRGELMLRTTAMFGLVGSLFGLRTCR